jgi:KDO2-lipid IV(A) lauroyltransferase
VAVEKHTRSSPLIGVVARLGLMAGRVLPVRTLQTLGGALGAAAARGHGRMREVSELNLAMCLPELDAARRRALVRHSLVETGRTAFEMGAVWGRELESLGSMIASVEGGGLVDAARASGRGVVLFLPHLGNWELFSHVLSRHGDFFALYRPARIAQVDRVMLEARERSRCTMIPATSQGVRRVLTALRAGELLVILPDQEPVRDHGVFAPLFGIPALTMTLACKLLARTGAAALFGTARRRSDGRFDAHIRTAPDDLGGPDLEVATAAMNREIEAAVRSCPEQYQWSYKRFRTRPEGELTPYRAKNFKPDTIGWLDPVIRARLEASGVRPTRG